MRHKAGIEPLCRDYLGRLSATASRLLRMDSASPSRTAQHMLALFLCEHGKLSLGKACEWGQMPMWEFIAQAQAMGVSIDGAIHEVNDDLTVLRGLAH